MIILEDVHPLADFIENSKAHIAHLNKTGQPEILVANGKAKVVVLSAKAFHRIHREYEVATLNNALHELLLEQFRVGKLSADQLKAELRPNPEALGRPVEEVFAELRRRNKARFKKKAR